MKADQGQSGPRNQRADSEAGQVAERAEWLEGGAAENKDGPVECKDGARKGKERNKVGPRDAGGHGGTARGTKVRLEGGVTELGSTKTELDSERNARQAFKAELTITRGALIVSNRKFASVLSLTRRQLFFLLILFFLLWFIWTWMQLSLAVVVNRPGSAHIVSRSERSLDGNEGIRMVV